jgi:hypothetical protein
VYAYSIKKGEFSVQKLRQVKRFVDYHAGRQIKVEATWVDEDEELHLFGDLPCSTLMGLVDLHIKENGAVTELGYEAIIKHRLDDFDLDRVQALANDEERVAQRTVAMMHHHGFMLEKDQEKSKWWLKRAAENGDGEALRILVEFNLFGMEGYQPNLEEAEFWLGALTKSKQYPFGSRVLMALYQFNISDFPSSEKWILQASQHADQKSENSYLIHLGLFLFLAHHFKLVNQEFVEHLLMEFLPGEIEQAVKEIKAKLPSHPEITEFITKALAGVNRLQTERRGGIREYTHYLTKDDEVLRTESISKDDVHYNMIAPVVMAFVGYQTLPLDKFKNMIIQEIPEDQVQVFTSRYFAKHP